MARTNAAAPAGSGGLARSVARPAARVNGRLLVVALLLGLLVAAGVLKALSVAAERHPVLVAAREVPAGAALTDADLTAVGLASDADVGALGAGQRGQLVGRTARHRLAAGQIVRADDVSREPAVGPGQRRVGVRLDRGRFPFDLEAGTAVRVVTEKSASYPAVVARFVKGPDGGADVVLIVDDAQADALARDVQGGKAALVAEAPR